MKLTPGEDLILKMIINLRTDFAVFNDMIMATLYKDHFTDEKSLNEFNSDLYNLRKEKQTEIVAQLKNLYSNRIGDIDDLINGLLDEK